jgi:low affinity Fe/Cu permease
MKTGNNKYRKPGGRMDSTMKKIGVALLFVVLGASTYLIFWSQYETLEITLFTSIGIIIGVFFVLNERITSAKIPFLELKAEIDKARSDVREIEEILANIKSQKEMIDLIVRDANTAQRQMSEIEAIADEAHTKVQEIERILKAAEEKETARRLRNISALGSED